MVWPIVIPQIDWAIFIKQMLDISGRSPAAILNSKREKVEGPAALLKAIALVGDRTVDLDHVSISFLIHTTCSASVLLSMRTDLALSVSDKIGDTEKVAVVATGTLKDWRNAFLSLCRENRPEEILEVFNDLYGYFEQANLTQFFAFQRVELASKFFIIKGDY